MVPGARPVEMKLHRRALSKTSTLKFSPGSFGTDQLVLFSFWADSPLLLFCLKLLRSSLTPRQVPLVFVAILQLSVSKRVLAGVFSTFRRGLNRGVASVLAALSENTRLVRGELKAKAAPRRGVVVASPSFELLRSLVSRLYRVAIPTGSL